MTALVVIVPAQAGLAATPSASTAARAATTTSTTAARRAVPPRTPQRETALAVPIRSDAQDGDAEDDASVDDGGAGDVPVIDGTDATDDDDASDVPFVDGTDADDDVSDVLADDSSSSAAGTLAARRDRTSGRWARVAAPTAVRATLAGASRARVTWRAAVGGLPAQQYVVQLSAGTQLLRATTRPRARSAALRGLVAGRRYTVTVTAVTPDGTSRAAVGAAVRAPAVAAAKRAPVSAKPAARRTAAVRPR